jgi:hypothetical protein
MLMNDKQIKIWKKLAVAYFKELSSIFPRRQEDNYEKPQ